MLFNLYFQYPYKENPDLVCTGIFVYDKEFATIEIDGKVLQQLHFAKVAYITFDPKGNTMIVKIDGLEFTGNYTRAGLKIYTPQTWFLNSVKE